MSLGAVSVLLEEEIFIQQTLTKCQKRDINEEDLRVRAKIGRFPSCGLC